VTPAFALLLILAIVTRASAESVYLVCEGTVIAPHQSGTIQTSVAVDATKLSFSGCSPMCDAAITESTETYISFRGNSPQIGILTGTLDRVSGSLSIGGPVKPGGGSFTFLISAMCRPSAKL
jgi:hypothetical protein